MVDPGGISNWSVTNVDWSEGKWHPRSYSAADVTYDLLKNITVYFLICMGLSHREHDTSVHTLTCITVVQAIDENFHVTSDDKVSTTTYSHYSF